MKRKMETYHIKLEDVYGECDTIYIDIITSRDIDDVIELITRAEKYWDSGHVDYAKIEYLYDVLSRNHIRFEEPEFISLDF